MSERRIDIKSDAAKEHIAMALLLMKDFQCEGRFDVEVTAIAMGFADALGVRAQFDKLIVQVPPMSIKARFE